tara:strand:- start:4004 stop:6106 length:2103 start_codon:yes stop_codon:yes gene_type:complete
MNIYMIASEDYKVFGVGQTTRSYQERHKDGDWSKFHNYLSARGEDLLLIGWWEDVNVVDHEIHRWLNKQPGVRKHAEWFSYTQSKMTIEMVKGMIAEEFFPEVTEAEKENLQLAHYQQAFVDKARGDYYEFLLAAKCRAGKSVMVLSHILDKGHKVSLVVSRFRSPSQSWIQDANRFVEFQNMVTINLGDKNWVEQVEYWTGTDKQIVLWSTVQGVMRKLDNLPEVDLLVVDEAHIGDKAQQFYTLRNHLLTKPCLKVSGTAYDQLWDTTEENRFVYDYFQEQIDVKAGLINRPRMEVILANYESDRYSAVYGDDPDAMKNLFLVRDGRFVDENLVREFVAKYFETNKELRTSDRLLHDSKHIYMTLPSVQACHLLQEILNPVIPTMVVTGETGADADDINKFVNEHTSKTICLTVSANVLGVTQSLWDTVINAREGRSIQFWNQFAFRAGSGDHNWRVIDFVPSRALESLRETFILSNDLVSTLSEYNFTDFVPIHEWNNGFTTLERADVESILASNPAGLARLMTGGTEGIDLDALTEVDFDSYLEHGKEMTASVVLSEDALNPVSAKQLVPGSRAGSEKTDLQKKIATVKSLLSLIPEVILGEHLKGNTLNTIQDVISTETYSEFTGDDALLRELLNDKVLSSPSLSRRVLATSQTIRASLQSHNASTILSEFQTATGTQQGVPTELREEMLQFLGI